jgi:hypothetical protein
MSPMLRPVAERDAEMKDYVESMTYLDDVTGEPFEIYEPAVPPVVEEEDEPER